MPDSKCRETQGPHRLLPSRYRRTHWKMTRLLHLLCPPSNQDYWGHPPVASFRSRFRFAACPQRGKHRRIGAHLLGFQPLELNRCPGRDEKRSHLALLPLVSGRRIVPAVDCPSQRRRIVFFVLEVYIGAADQPSRQPILTQQRRPMESGLPKESA